MVNTYRVQRVMLFGLFMRYADNIITVEFIKKNGTVRRLSGFPVMDRHYNLGMPYIIFAELSQLSDGAVFRNVNLNSVSQVIIGNNVYIPQD